MQGHGDDQLGPAMDAAPPDGDSEDRLSNDCPWIADDDRQMRDLLGLRLGPGADRSVCPWFLGLLDVGDPDVRLASWRVAVASMKNRCGETPVYALWEATVISGGTLSASDRRRLDPFLTNVYGTPEAPAPADHLEGHVAEVLWHLLTIEYDGPERALINSEGPSFSVTETGGDGLTVWADAEERLSFHLWEIKKHTGGSHVSRTIGSACGQLSESAERYLAKYASIGSRQNSGALGRFYGRLVDLWVDDDAASGAAVAIATSRNRAPVQRSFGTLVTTFPEKANGTRLEGLLVAVADFSDFAALTRSFVWRGHSTSGT
jgi:hypothetical protein